MILKRQHLPSGWGRWESDQNKRGTFRYFRLQPPSSFAIRPASRRFREKRKHFWNMQSMPANKSKDTIMAKGGTEKPDLENTLKFTPPKKKKNPPPGNVTLKPHRSALLGFYSSISWVSNAHGFCHLPSFREVKIQIFPQS